MNSYKVCIAGNIRVGKTSLIRRVLHDTFSSAYLTTIGVKISQKLVTTTTGQVNLILWDLAGNEINHGALEGYIRGSHGAFLVGDITDITTLDALEQWNLLIGDIVGQIPVAIVTNKQDLNDQGVEFDDHLRDILGLPTGSTIHRTSAKTGQGVEEAFRDLTRAILRGDASTTQRMGG